MNTWTEIERRRYERIYKSKPNYGVSDFDRYSEFFPEISDRSLKVLDLGCGAAHLSDHYDFYFGYDISDTIIERNKEQKNGQYKQGTLFDLRNFNRWAFDAVFCNDVMEHIPIAMVGLVLSEISRVPSKTYYFKIHKGESNHEDDTGNLHRTIATQNWWERMLSEFFVIEEYFCKGKGMDSGYLSYFKCTSKENWQIPDKIF